MAVEVGRTSADSVVMIRGMRVEVGRDADQNPPAPSFTYAVFIHEPGIPGAFASGVGEAAAHIAERFGGAVARCVLTDERARPARTFEVAMEWPEDWLPGALGGDREQQARTFAAMFTVEVGQALHGTTGAPVAATVKVRATVQPIGAKWPRYTVELEGGGAVTCKRCRASMATDEGEAT